MCQYCKHYIIVTIRMNGHFKYLFKCLLGVALRDSPVGLAAYILEKFITWTNPEWKNLEDGGLTQRYTYTKLLDNIMIYWVTRSITTSIRLYAETFNKTTANQQLFG